MARYSQDVDSFDDQVFDESKSVRDIWGIAEHRDFENKLCKKTDYLKFNLKLRQLHKKMGEYALDIGEGWCMINKVTGYVQDTIPFFKIDLAINWIEKNYHRHLFYLAPELHRQLMDMENDVFAMQYKERFLSHEQLINNWKSFRRE